VSPSPREAGRSADTSSGLRALRRELGLLDAVAIGIGAVVGAGIFVVVGVAAGIGGPSLLAGLVLAGVAASANALSSAQLAAAYPVAGGTYEYGYRVLGAVPGFSAGWMFLASKTAALGTVALGIGAYLGTLLPGVPPRAVAAAAVLAFTALNYRGIRRSSLANLAIVTISVGVLLLLVAVAVPHVDVSRLRPFVSRGVPGFLEASAVLFFAYTGYARIATLGEEVKQPARTIPLAIVITVALSLALYLGVTFVSLGVVGAAGLAATGAPLERVAYQVGGSPLAVTVAIGGVVAMLGVILSQLLGLSRMVLAMARRGDLPPVLGAIHHRYGVPHRAVLLMGAVGTLVAVTGTLRGVAEAASFTILVYYGIANVAAFRMSRAAKLVPDVVPVIGLVACVTLALSLSVTTITTGVAVLLAGFVLRALLRATARD
jgi:APA family basic amino acid/polyamine antiporter